MLGSRVNNYNHPPAIGQDDMNSKFDRKFDKLDGEVRQLRETTSELRQRVEHVEKDKSRSPPGCAAACGYRLRSYWH